MAQSPQAIGPWVRFRMFLGAAAGAGVALVSFRKVARFTIDNAAIESLADPLLISEVDRLAATPLPTLGEWGMLFATLSLLAAGTSVIIRRRRR